MVFKTQSDFLKKIQDGIFQPILYQKVHKFNEIEKKHIQLDQLRSSLDYDIDGLVYKVNDI